MSISVDDIVAFRPRMRLRHCKNKRVVTLVEVRIHGAYIRDPLATKRSKSRFISNRTLRMDYEYVDMLGE